MIVRGETKSRLSELKRYGLHTDITSKYIGGGDVNNNGVDFSAIEYIDVDLVLRAVGNGEVRGYGNSIDNIRSTNEAVRLWKIVYYIDGIKYVDDVINEITYFEYYALGTSNPHFIQPPIDKDYNETPIYKDPKKENIIGRPKIQDGLFIVRQEVSAFDKNYKLQHVNNLVELTTYLGGNYFNIVNNT